MKIITGVQYGEAFTLNFALYSYTDGKDLVTNAVHAAADTTVMLNEGTPANTTNAFADEGDFYSLVLTAAEMSAARIMVKIADQGSKAWLDDAYLILTSGHPSAHDPRGVINRDTAAAIAAGSITLGGSALGTDDAYNDFIVKIVSNGTAAANGQARYIRDYTGATKIATLNLNWTITPTGTVVYEIFPAPAGVSDVNLASVDGDTPAATALKNNIANLDAAVSTRSSHTAANVRSEMDSNSTQLAAIKSDTAAILLDTGTDGVVLASGAITSAKLAASASEALADALLNRNVAGGSNTGRLVKEAIAFLRNRRAISGGTLTVYATDDSTPLWTAAVGTAAGDPVTSIDPA